MKIKLLSDIHTEFGLPYQTHAMSEYNGEDVLVLAGDISSGVDRALEVIKFFKAQGFPKIVYVPGNHEYYHTEFDLFNSAMAAACRDLENVYFLNPGVVTIDGVLFIGATLWTNFADNPLSQSYARRSINDFAFIKNFDTNRCAKTYYEHYEFIKYQYEQRGNRKVVVVTHFLPARECIAERWRGPNLLNDYFANDLGDSISEMSDTTWMFGHTHDSVDIMLGETRVVANPHGYYRASYKESKNENTVFDPHKTIVL